MLDQIQTQLYRLILHNQDQKWALAVKRGSELIYPHQTTPLTPEEVLAHIECKITLGVMLLQTGTNTAKAGCIDIDIPRDAPTLKDALEIAYKVKKAALEKGLDTYIEFSGNRGFHVWLFALSPLPGKTWRLALEKIATLAGFTAEEIFPSHELTEFKCIKLPGALHLKSNRQAGFITDNPTWDAEGFPLLPDQTELLKTFIQNRASDIALLADMVETKSSTEQNNSNKFVLFPPNQHPSCINHLLTQGAPLELDYNDVNMTLARYALARNLSESEAVTLAETIAKHTPDNHPTSKDDWGKVHNFKSVYNSAQRKPDDYSWRCSYALAKIKTHNQTELTARGCIGEKCPLWPYTHQPFSSKHTLSLALVWRSVSTLAAKGIELRISTILLELKNNTEKVTLNKATEADLALESEVLAYILQKPEILTEILSLHIPDQGFISATSLTPTEFLNHLNTANLPNPAVFYSYLDLIRDRGLRSLTQTQLNQTRIDCNNPNQPLPETLTTLTQATNLLLRRTVSDIQPMNYYTQGLITDLFSRAPQSIPTPSLWLNNVFNGGFAPGKLYVIAAPPGGGKTTFCTWCGDYAAASGIPVLMAAYEMSRHQLWIYALARLAGINSALIESKSWLNEDYQAKDSLLNRLEKATKDYHYQISPSLTIVECGAEYTPARLRGVINQLRYQSRVADNTPVLVIVDYLQLLSSGDEKVDASALETLRVSKIATQLKQLTRDTNSAIIAISDITKAAYQQAISTGFLDMSALRDSFKIAHAADIVGLLQTGRVKVKGGDKSGMIDQLELAAQNTQNNPDKIRLINLARTRYKLVENTDTYARLSILKNRGGICTDVLYVYHKASHRFTPIDLNLGAINYEENI